MIPSLNGISCQRSGMESRISKGALERHREALAFELRGLPFGPRCGHPARPQAALLISKISNWEGCSPKADPSGLHRGSQVSPASRD